MVNQNANNMNITETIKTKKTPTDFMIEEFNELYDHYKKIQFSPVNPKTDPIRYYNQKKRFVFDILCDRLGSHNSKEYDELLNRLDNDKLTELQNYVLKETEFDVDVVICRSIWHICKKNNINTADELSNHLHLTPVKNKTLIEYFRSYANEYIKFKKNNYLTYMQENISFWRATKGESLPVTEKAYLWAEAIWLCHARVGYCCTDEIWRDIKKTF